MLRQSILVVDDEPVIRTSVAEALASESPTAAEDARATDECERAIAAALEKHGIVPGAKDGMSSWLSRAMAMPGTPGSVPGDEVLDQDVLRHIRLPGCAHGLGAAK